MSIYSIDKNLHIENVAVQYRARPGGSEPKPNTCSDGFTALRTILRLLRRSWFPTGPAEMTIMVKGYVIE